MALFPAAWQLSAGLTSCCVLGCFEATYARGGILDVQTFGPECAENAQVEKAAFSTTMRHSMETFQNHPGLFTVFHLFLSQKGHIGRHQDTGIDRMGGVIVPQGASSQRLSTGIFVPWLPWLVKRTAFLSTLRCGHWVPGRRSWALGMGHWQCSSERY